MSNDQRLKSLASEVGGGRATARNIEEAIELGVMPLPSAAEDPFRDEVQPDAGLRRPESFADSDGPSTKAESEGTMSTFATRPQQVRSMLDI